MASEHEDIHEYHARVRAIFRSSPGVSAVLHGFETRFRCIPVEASRTRTRGPGLPGWRPGSNEVISGFACSPRFGWAHRWRTRERRAEHRIGVATDRARRPYRLPEELPGARRQVLVNRIYRLENIPVDEEKN